MVSHHACLLESKPKTNTINQNNEQNEWDGMRAESELRWDGMRAESEQDQIKSLKLISSNTDTMLTSNQITHTIESSLRGETSITQTQQQ